LTDIERPAYDVAISFLLLSKPDAGRKRKSRVQPSTVRMGYSLDADGRIWEARLLVTTSVIPA